MKRKLKDGTGLYAYLNSIGVLENGTNEEINSCKKAYWARYRKEWKKNKRQQSKSYIILCSFKEAKMINQRAQRVLLTPTRFIKRSALSNDQSIGPVLTGQIREQVILCSTKIELIMTEKRIPEPIKDEITTAMQQMEMKVLSILTPK